MLVGEIIFEDLTLLSTQHTLEVIGLRYSTQTLKHDSPDFNVYNYQPENTREHKFINI